MRINKTAFYCFLVAICFMILNACQKETNNTVITTPGDSYSQGVIASDEVFVNDEVDQAIDDGVLGLSICKPTSGSNSVNPATLAGAVIDTSQVDSGIVNIYYYSKESDTSRSRSGSIEIKLPVVNHHVIPWSTVGVTATITFTTYEIYYLTTTNTTLWFKGTFSVTNYSGGSLKSLIPGDSLVEKVRGPIQYTYNDNGAILTLYLWNLHRTRVIEVTGSNNVTVTTRGDTTVSGFSNVSNWGTDRFSNTYYTSVTTPLFQNLSSPSFYSPLSGTKIINGISEPITMTLGVNNQGVITSGTPYGFNTTWTNSLGAQKSVIAYLP